MYTALYLQAYLRIRVLLTLSVGPNMLRLLAWLWSSKGARGGANQAARRNARLALAFVVLLLGQESVSGAEHNESHRCMLQEMALQEGVGFYCS